MKSRSFLVPTLLLALSACDQSPPEGEVRGTWDGQGSAKADRGASCAGHCDEEAPAGCWCDESCVTYGDCCADYEPVCVDEDPCFDVSCEVPAPHCDGNELIEYEDARCDPTSGECRARPQTTVCEFGCADAACKSPPPASDDPFDPSSCIGEPITPAEMLALFESGASWVDLGEYRVDRRTSECMLVNDTGFTTCAPWTVETQIIRTMPAGTTTSSKRSLVGTARLRLTDDDIQLRLESEYGRTPTSPYGSRCNVADEVTCGTFSYLSSQQWGGSGGYFNHSSVLYVGSPAERVRMTGVLTNHCLRLSHRATSDRRIEEVAVLVRF